MNSELKERHENEIIPDGFSYVDNTPHGGRIHFIYQWQEGNITKRIKFAFAGKISQFLATFTGYTEEYNQITQEYHSEEIKHGRTISNANSEGIS